jgi:hypothetical protein
VGNIEGMTSKKTSEIIEPRERRKSTHKSVLMVYDWALMGLSVRGFESEVIVRLKAGILFYQFSDAKGWLKKTKIENSRTSPAKIE